MQKPFCTVMTVLLVFAILLGLTSAIYAAPSDEIEAELRRLQTEQEEIAAEKEALKEELGQTDEQLSDFSRQKQAIDREIELNRQNVENLQLQLRQLSLLIAQKQEELDGVNAELETLLAQYRTRMRAMQEQGEVSLWAVIFQSHSFEEMLNRTVMVEEIAKADQRMLAQLRSLSAQVLDAKQALADEKSALELKKTELAEAEDALAEKRAEADAMLAQLSADKEALAQELADAEAAEEAAIAQIAAKEAEYNRQKEQERLEQERLEQERLEQERQNATATPSESPDEPTEPDSEPSEEPNEPSEPDGTTTESYFLFPVDPAGFQMITDAYGYRTHPITGNYSLHNGVDLASYQGTSVYASKSGTVTTADYSYALGNYVVINHGDGYSTMYAHMTHFTVSVGDTVSQGEVIGYVGSTGVYSTGPHLHFTVYYNGGTVNPMGYISLP